MNHLFVRWPERAGDAFDWLELDAQAQCLSAGQCTAEQITELTERTVGRRLVILLRTSACVLTPVTVPAKQQRHLSKVLPYLVEDVLTVPVDDMHILAGRALDAERFQTIAIAHREMQALLQTCAEWQWHVEAVGVDALCLGELGTARLLIETGSTLLTLADGSAQVLNHNDVPSLVPLLVQEQTLDIYRSDASVTLDMVGAVHDIDNSLLLLARGFLAHPFNLLQGPYQRQQSLAKHMGQWKWPLLVCASALLLQYLYWLGDALVLHYRHNALQREMQAVYKSAFPDSGETNTPHTKMKLMMKRYETVDTGFFTALDTVSNALNGSGVSLVGLNYDADRGDTKLSLTAADLSPLNDLQSQMQAQGINAELGQAAATDNGYSGTLTLHTGNKK